MSDLTLRILRGMSFSDLYVKLMTKDRLDDEEIGNILQIAIVFLNSKNNDLKKLGYRMIVAYSNMSGDYIPLYDVSVNLGYIPLAKIIESSFSEREGEVSFFKEFQSSFIETFKRGSIYFTHEQFHLNKTFLDHDYNDSTAVVAPTSYGKSELIMSSLGNDHNVCIIVPTKALLAQTKKRVLQSEFYSDDRKIITHHEMFVEGDQSIIAILTQERLIKLFQSESELSFDVAFIDEAHNLLVDDDRNRLLATSVMLLRHRNPGTVLNFLTPFLVDVDNLKTSYTDYELKELKVSEYIKTEKVYLCDFRKEDKSLMLYDQFLDKMIVVNENPEYSSETDLIINNSRAKNIIYMNRPVNIERFVSDFIEELEEVDYSPFETELEDIKDFLHQDYTLLKCLKKGVVYHHGSVPDNIKLFIEHLYSIHDEIKYIITTSTLLEGVNIPAEKLFLMSNKKGQGNLSQSQFKNLVGRICRFNELFKGGIERLDLLEPEVFMVGSRYVDKRARLDNFLSKVLKVDKKISDKPENILLEETKLNDAKRDEKEKFEEFLENLEPELTDREDVQYARTDFGKSCFSNNVLEIDVLAHELSSQEKVDTLIEQGRVANDSSEVISLIYELFLVLITEDNKYKSLVRLRDDLGARNFYSLFLNWRMLNFPYKQMIAQVIEHWDGRIRTGEPHVYVGKWGDDKREGNVPNWVNLENKSNSEKINLSIVRIKEELDFLENGLLKFVEVLNDLSLINSDTYLKIKYGTSEQTKILMIKSGISLSLSGALLSRYSNLIEVNSSTNQIKIDKEVIEKMQENDESSLLIFETSLNIKS